ncbi:MAG: hypothetical protein FWC00_02985 [Firmicutes bacterium]|nr:hypothetical protein [Bacillota bacterium]
MNPTGKNVASKKDWTGPRYPWLETKTIWKLFADIGIISSALNQHIQSMKPLVWTPEFCEQVYGEVRNKKAYITNLAKCTQVDARPLPDRVFKEYLDLFSKEMNIIKPKVIILFGNQVSSIVLGKNIKVSEQRKIEHNYNGSRVYSVFYPVGNGRFNLPKAIEDLKWIMDKHF